MESGWLSSHFFFMFSFRFTLLHKQFAQHTFISWYMQEPSSVTTQPQQTLLCCSELVHSWILVGFVCFMFQLIFLRYFSFFYFHSKYLAFSLQQQKLHTWSQLRVISWHHNFLFLRQRVIYWEIHKLSFNPVQFLPECHHFHAINLSFLIRYFFTLWIFFAIFTHWFLFTSFFWRSLLWIFSTVSDEFFLFVEFLIVIKGKIEFDFILILYFSLWLAIIFKNFLKISEIFHFPHNYYPHQGFSLVFHHH